MSFSFPRGDTRIRTDLDGETSVGGCVAYITGRNYVDGQTKCQPMGGNDHREWAAFGGSNSMLEFPQVTPDMKRRASSIYRVRRDYGESRVYCNFNTVKLVMTYRVYSRLAVETGGEEFVQPRGEDDDSHVVLQTNSFKYFGVFTPDAESVGHKMLVKGQTPSSAYPIPLVKCIHRCSVYLDEIYVGSRNRDLEVFSTEMRHGRVVHRGDDGTV